MPIAIRASGFLAVLALAACSSGPERVSSHRYRALILTIDSVTIQGPTFRENRSWAGTALRALGHSLLTDVSVDSSRRVEMNNQLRELASRTDGIGSEIRLSGEELEKAWIDTRGAVFKSAAWFIRASRGEDGRSGKSGENEMTEEEAARLYYPPVDPELAGAVEAVDGMIMVAGQAGLDLHREPPGSIGYQRAVTALNREVDRLESLLTPVPGTPPDSNLTLARTEAREALRYLREYIAAGADTMPGTPAREALEKVAEHAVDARWALERVQ